MRSGDHVEDRRVGEQRLGRERAVAAPVEDPFLQALQRQEGPLVRRRDQEDRRDVRALRPGHRSGSGPVEPSRACRRTSTRSARSSRRASGRARSRAASPTERARRAHRARAKTGGRSSRRSAASRRGSSSTPPRPPARSRFPSRYPSSRSRFSRPSYAWMRNLSPATCTARRSSPATIGEDSGSSIGSASTAFRSLRVISAALGHTRFPVRVSISSVPGAPGRITIGGRFVRGDGLAPRSGAARRSEARAFSFEHGLCALFGRRLDALVVHQHPGAAVPAKHGVVVTGGTQRLRLVVERHRATAATRTPSHLPSGSPT